MYMWSHELWYNYSRDSTPGAELVPRGQLVQLVVCSQESVQSPHVPIGKCTFAQFVKCIVPDVEMS